MTRLTKIWDDPPVRIKATLGMLRTLTYKYELMPRDITEFESGFRYYSCNHMPLEYEPAHSYTWLPSARQESHRPPAPWHPHGVRYMRIRVGKKPNPVFSLTRDFL